MNRAFLSTLPYLFMRVFQTFIQPRSRTEKAQRHEFILTILLISTFLLTLIAFIVALSDAIVLKSSYNGVSPRFLLLPLTVFAILYFLARHRYARIAAYLLIAIYFLLGTFTLARWSILLPQGILIYTVVIVMSGLLISGRVAFVATALVATSLFILTYLQKQAIIQPDLTWLGELSGYNDIFVYVVTFGILTTISWLYNHELEKSLARAEASERALKHERDNLERRVEARTRELKQVHYERLIQMQRFAEFGQVASSFVHDLVTPLMTVSHNLEQLRHEKDTDLIHRAQDGAKRLEHYIQAAQKQLQQQEEQCDFSLKELLDQVFTLAASRAREHNIKLTASASEDIIMYGNPLKFQRALMNLVINAIDAYQDAPGANRTVAVIMEQKPHRTIVRIEDHGAGISRSMQRKIFEPFFTTKVMEKGTGLGLAITKDIIEHDFGGRIFVKSSLQKGTLFTLSLPVTHGKHN